MNIPTKLLSLLFAALVAMPVLASADDEEMEKDPQKHRQHMSEHIANMRQAAAELRATDPDTAGKLESLSNKAQEKMDNWEAEKQKRMDEMAEHLAVMRKAAASLKATNPDLAKKLEDAADKKQKKMEKKSQKVAEAKNAQAGA
jgi:ABC-type transport system involved in cytochrome bd biosynthesis fused ATPase/permease subunit